MNERMQAKETEIRERNKQREAKAKAKEVEAKEGALRDYQQRQKEIAEKERIKEEERLKGIRERE